MEAGRCIKVLNPYEWLPSYGENSIQIYMDGTDLTILVAYDSEDGVQKQKKIKFEKVVGFYKGSFPGPKMLGVTYNTKDDEKNSIGNIVEFPESEAARIWTAHYQGIWNVKHYKWIFLSENIMLEIFAEGVQMEDYL